MSFLTRTGEAQIANKQASGGRVNITHFVFAYLPELGEEPADRVESLPAVEHIVDTQPYLKVAYVNENQVVYSVVLDATVGDYDFNWIGLVDDENVLIATAYITTIGKRKTKGNKRGNTISRNFLLKYTGIQKVTAATVPAETWQLDFTERFLGVDERERQSNYDLYAQGSFLGEAWSVIEADGQYQVSAGTGYVGGIRVQNNEPKSVSPESLPTSVWLEASLQGDIADRKPVTSLLVQTDAPEAETQDANGVTYYRTKLADISADGDIIDTRFIYENVAQHEAKEDPHPQYKTYTDSKTSTALTTAKGDATRKSNAALASAKEYTDEQVTAARESAEQQVNAAQQYADQQADAALAQAKEFVGDFIGSIHFFASSSAPVGFIKANGAAISRTTYAALFSKIGTRYGAGNGSSTFNVPDLRGEFVRGWDEGRGVDSGRGFGSWQADEFRSHTHNFTRENARGGGSAGSEDGSSSFYTTKTAAAGGNETRPRNIALAAYIKY
ncbi:phage tail protein [Marinomonas aquiplantarum]|uniref:Microcystin-dependent protein n=1 Tax=Marinomonas aquiplantarum TaxID=491951 RepID=A0A366D7H9_9GAMM|nr:phage tail protein [Marinomonas aquiplantarum]RBO85905.1 microcystin-dependent protein [Marinomonas aquiplantarum]